MSIAESIRHYRIINEFDAVELPGPPSAREVQRADAVARRLCGQPLPKLVHELWQSLATIGADGTEIYPPRDVEKPDPVQGVVEANEAYPPPAGMVHVGRRDEDQISWRASDGHVFLTDVGSNRPLEVADSLETYYEEIIAGTLAHTVGLIEKHREQEGEKG